MKNEVELIPSILLCISLPVARTEGTNKIKYYYCSIHRLSDHVQVVGKKYFTRFLKTSNALIILIILCDTRLEIKSYCSI